MGALVAGAKYRGEFEEKLKKIMKKVKEDPNAIIFIDEITHHERSIRKLCRIPQYDGFLFFQ